MSSATQAMVFAAGFGTRMGAMTKNRPKPLIPVAGRALLDYALDYLGGAQIADVVVNTHYHGVQIAAHVATRTVPHVKISSEDTILETGGGLRHALPLFDSGPIITLNSDAIWQPGQNPIDVLRNAWRPDMGALLLLVRRENALGHKGAGDFFLESDGRLTRRGDHASAPYVYSGAQILYPQGLNDIPLKAFSLNILWDQMIAQQRLYGVVFDGNWVDVGRPEGVDIATEMVTQA